MTLLILLSSKKVPHMTNSQNASHCSKFNDAFLTFFASQSKILDLLIFLFTYFLIIYLRIFSKWETLTLEKAETLNRLIWSLIKKQCEMLILNGADNGGNVDQENPDGATTALL